MTFYKTAPLLLAAVVLVGQDAPHGGIDRANLDLTCKPCADFWRYANGGWVDKNPIPARLSGWGTFSVLTEANRERLRVILETAAANQSASPGSNERKIGDFYASCMDTAAIDGRGIQPLQADLDRIDAVHSVKDLVAALIEFQRTARLRQAAAVGPAVLIGAPNPNNSKEVIAWIVAGGRSLPDRDYYFKEDARSKEIRGEFLKHVAKMFEMLGQQPESAATSRQDRRLLNTNPHPLGRFRVIGTLQNMPEFHAAFQCKPGDPMVRPPAAQCKLW